VFRGRVEAAAEEALDHVPGETGGRAESAGHGEGVALEDVRGTAGPAWA
jgi:hypothetical protein